MAPRPFHVAPSPSTAAAPRGRLLLVSYSFVPIRDVGSVRWQKLSDFAAERGWAIDVIMRQPTGAELADAAYLAELPAGTRLFGIAERASFAERVQLGAWRAARALRPGRRAPGAATATERVATPARTGKPGGVVRAIVRANHVAMYFARFGQWVREAARIGTELAATTRYDAVITSGPPHVAHLAGRDVSRRTGLPFVMDLRDPWSVGQRIDDELESPLWWWQARRLERSAVAQASLLVANTDQLRLAMAERHPGAADRIVTVMNGSDDEPLPSPRAGRRFVAAYAGEIYWDRDPRPLFRAVAQVARDLALAPSEFGVELMGAVEQCRGVPTMRIAEEEGAGAYVTLRPRGSRQQAMEFLAGAHVLVSLPLVATSQSERGRDLTVPAKIFEYSRFPAWVLALADRGSATAAFLRDTDADVVAPYDVAGIAAALRRRVDQHRAGLAPRPLDPDGRFSRRRQATRLLDALDRLVGTRAAVGTPRRPAPARSSSDAREIPA